MGQFSYRGSPPPSVPPIPPGKSDVDDSCCEPTEMQGGITQNQGDERYLRLAGGALTGEVTQSFAPINPTDLVRLMDLTFPDGILTGLALSLSGGNVLVAPGTWRIADIIYASLVTQSFVLDTQDTTYSRYDVLYADNTDTIHMISGSLSLTPLEPSIPNGTIKLGAVLITPTSVTLVAPPVTGFVDTTTNQNVNGIKNFMDGIQSVTRPVGDSTLWAATTQWVQNELNADAIYFVTGTFNGAGTIGSPYSINVINLLPSQTGNAGKVLSTDGAGTLSWIVGGGGGGGTWGTITGTLSSQTDLQSALDAKQVTLVSGTNIKTINSISLLGAGDIAISSNNIYNSNGTLTGARTLSTGSNLFQIQGSVTGNQSLGLSMDNTGGGASTILYSQGISSSEYARILLQAGGGAPFGSPHPLLILESLNGAGTTKNITINALPGTNGIVIQDTVDSKGATYGADYSANFTARSLIDKGYADAHYGSGTVSSFGFTNGSGFTGSVSNSTTTPALSLTLQNATTSQSGQLTNTDWNTFNNKQSALTFSNGLTNTSGTVKLGGTLTGNTTIPFSTFQLLMGSDTAGAGTGSYFNLSPGIFNIQIGGGTNALGNLVITTSSSDIYTTNISSLQAGIYNRLSASGPFVAGLNVYDQINSKGLVYVADYSANYTARSLIDKGYADAHYGTGSGSVTSVSVVTANGISGSVVNATTTPAITLTLGAITPTSTNGVSAATMAFNDATSSIQTQINSKLSTVTAASTYLPLGGGTLTGFLILNADPTNALHAATKNYVDNIIIGVIWVGADVATTANITLSGEQTIDGVTTSSSRVFVKNQTIQSDNGVYISNSGAWTRSSDATTGAQIIKLAIIIEGGGQKSNQWVNTNSSVTVGVTAITFAQSSGIGTYTNGTGLLLTGTAFSIDSSYTANGSRTGYLSSSDWTTFNNKQASGNYVTSIVLSGSGILHTSPTTFSVSSGAATATMTLATQTANLVFAGPSTGSAATPTFRSLVAADIPTLNQNTTGTAANITGSSNSTITTLSALSLPYSQLTGAPSLSGYATLASPTFTGIPLAVTGALGDNTTQIATDQFVQQNATGTEPNYFYPGSLFKQTRANFAINAALSVQNSTQTPVHIMFMGDSRMGINPNYILDMVSQYGKLNSIGFIAPYSNIYGSAVTWSQTGAVTRNDNTSAATFGIAGSRLDLTGTQAWSVQPASRYPADKIRIFYNKTVGGGTFSWAIDGGAATNVNTDPGSGSDTLGTVTISSGLNNQNSHTVLITNVSGSSRIYGIDFQQQAQSGFIVDILQSGSSQVSNWAANMSYTTQYVALTAPAAAVIWFDVNDAISSVSRTTYMTNIRALVSGLALPATSSPIFMTYLAKQTASGSGISDTVPNGLMANYRTDLLAGVATDGWAVVDTFTADPSISYMNTNGMYLDDRHQSIAAAPYRWNTVGRAIFPSFVNPNSTGLYPQYLKASLLIAPTGVAGFGLATESGAGGMTETNTGWYGIISNSTSVMKYQGAGTELLRMGSNGTTNTTIQSFYPTSTYVNILEAFRQGSTVNNAFKITVNSDNSSTISTNNANLSLSAAGVLLNNGASSSSARTFVAQSGTSTTTSGNTFGVSIGMTYNQASGTGNNTDFLINRTETTLQSGTQLLIDAQVSGASKFSVDNTGKLINTMNQTIKGSTSGAVSIITQAAAGTYNFNLPITAGIAEQVLTSQGGVGTAMTWTTPAGAVNIYNTNGTLTGNRTISTTSGFTLTIAPQVIFNGSITASNSLARGNYTNQTLTAVANNDVLIADDINPAFTVGSFTGVATIGQRIQMGTFGVGILATPGAPACTPSITGGTLVAGTYYYKIVAFDVLGGTTLAGAETSTTVASGTTGKVVLTWSAVPYATGYRVYRGTTSNNQTVYYTISNTVNGAPTFTDTGAANTAGTTPIVNGTVVSAIGTDGTINGVNFGYGNNQLNNNLVIGYTAGNAITTGASNLFIGALAGTSNTIGTYNSFIGYQAGNTNISGNQCTFIGYQAGRLSTTGNNSAVGYQAGCSIGSGAANSFFGTSCGQAITSGNYNTFMGTSAGYSVPAGSTGNTLIGNSAGSGFTSAVNFNTGVGDNVMNQATSGGNNTALGYNSGRNISAGGASCTSLDNSIFVGAQANPLANSQTNQIVIGYSVYGLGSNTTSIGNSSTVKTLLYGGVMLSAGYTVSTLPTGAQGMIAWVTDSLSPVIGSAVASGGSAFAGVMYNGTQWTVFSK